MAVPEFPITLPKVVMSSYGYEAVNGRVRTDMDTGLARQRRRFISTPTNYQVKWVFTLKELGVFEKFYFQDLSEGVSWFTLKLVNGAAENTVSARFVDTPKTTSTGNGYHWEVTATLETIGRPILP